MKKQLLRRLQTLPETPPKQGALNQKEAALFLGISSKSLRGLARQHAIPCRQAGRQFLFSIEALQKWLIGNDDASGNETIISENNKG